MAHSARPDLERVFRAEYGRVVAVARRVVADAGAAEDVAQEVFLEFARSDVPGPDAGRWLSVAAVHRALNAVRSQKRRAGREARAEADPTSSVTAAGAADAGDAADAVIVNLERARVRAALAALPRTQSVALVLRHSGMSYADIAEALGIAASGVGTTVRRAEAALREELIRDDARG